MSAASCRASSARSHLPVPVLCLSVTGARTWSPRRSRRRQPRLFGMGQDPPPGIISGSWPSCRCWPRHGRGLGKARPTRLMAAAPSSLGCHLQVPHVQSSQGPAGEGQPHTYSQKRAACLLVELRTPPSPCQLATAQGNTVKAALISDPAPAGPLAGP